MSSATVRVRGLGELQRDFRKMSKDLAKEVRGELREVAEPVRAEAQRLLAPLDAGSAAGYKVRVRTRGVAVEQSRRRTTGRRPDWGALQMRRVLLPALASQQSHVFRGLERMLDRLAGNNGFH